MKNHLKRVTSPKSWGLPRRERVFITRPKPSGHPLDMGLPLGVVIRDLLKLASTMSEVKKILNNKEVLIDGKRRRDHRFLVGLFDVVSLPSLQKHYRMLLDLRGCLTLLETSPTEAGMKLCRVVGKTVLPGGKIQYHLHDGKNVFLETAASVGDSLSLSIPAQKAQKIFPLRAGATVLLAEGKNAGHFGVLKELRGVEATYAAPDGNTVETVKKYLFVVGEKEPAIILSSKVKGEKQTGK